MSTKSKAFVRYRLISHHIEANSFLYVVIVEVSKGKKPFVFSDKYTREFLTLPEAKEYIATLRTKQY